MDNKKSLWYVIAGLSVLVVVLLIVVAGKGPQTPGTNTAVTPPGATPQGTTGNMATPPPSAPKSISVTSPAANAEWVIGGTNRITWSREAGLVGAIYLIDAASKTTVGWIVSNTDRHQTSFTWDTKTVFLSRNSGLTKSITTGKYIVKISFDGPQSEVQSGAFSVIQSSQVKIPSHTIVIKDYRFSPKELTISRGDTITFVNNDPIDQRVILTGLSPQTLKPGESFAFQTTGFTTGKYDFYSDAYSSLAGVLTVQ